MYNLRTGDYPNAARGNRVFELRERAQAEGLRNRVIAPDTNKVVDPRLCIECQDSVLTISDYGFRCKQCRLSSRVA